MGTLSGKVAIITGGSRGQGAAEARLFASEGARVVITDVNDAGRELAAEIGEAAFFKHHDVSDEASWADTVAETLQRFGRVDILVNNAALYEPATLTDTTRELWDLIYRVNQLGVFLGMKAVANAMAEGGGGSIVNISSQAGISKGPGMFAYGSSKWAVRGMSQYAALDYAPLKIRVNAIFPGAIDTPMLLKNPPEFMEMVKANIPMKRLGTPLEIANVALFLASDASSYMTGSEIAVNGGL
jgi:3alpha(or 20beta)-hydroxysteroid dehydrogenase